MSSQAGVALVANFSVNVAFSGAVRNVATSPYAKWLNINSASSSSLLAATSQFANCDLGCGSAPLPGTSPVNEGRDLDDKRASCYFGLYVDRPPCLWIKFAYFSDEWRFVWTESVHTHICKSSQSPYQSGQQEIVYPAKHVAISVIISGQSTEDMIPNMESEATQCA